MAKKKNTVPMLPEGFFDIVPDDQRFWHYVWKRANGLLADYSFNRLDLAPAEHAQALVLPVEATDEDAAKRLIVGKTKDGTQLALRNNMAASIMRVYLQHGMHTLPHPIKMFSSAPVVGFGGKGQEMHYQLGVQTIGDTSEAVDAELLFLGCRIIEALGLGSFTVRLNTVGDAIGRPAYLRALRDYFRTHQKQMSARAQAAAKQHPFKGLEVLAQEVPELAKDAPQSVDFLSDEARMHFKRLLEFLDEGQVPYIIDHTLVRTDDYASHTVWEFTLDPFSADDGQAPADKGLIVLTGGRYDRLAELLGGAKTPAAGWVLDVDSIVARLKAKNVAIPDGGPRPKVFLSQLGDAAKKRSLMLFEQIRQSGIEVRYSLSRDTIKGQLRMAARFGVRFALIFGQKEALEGTVILREMETGIQETIPLEKIIDELKKRLKAKS
jgi:histidyl-tRNA synthetase